jgi:UrcA family protein
LSLAISLAIVCSAGGGIRAGAASDLAGEQQSVRVLVKDLDLGTHAGVVTLYLRIRNAARFVCGYADSIFLEEKAAWDRCVHKAIENAVAQVDSANFTDFYLARTRSASPPPEPGESLLQAADNSRPMPRHRSRQ